MVRERCGSHLTVGNKGKSHEHLFIKEPKIPKWYKVKIKKKIMPKWHMVDSLCMNVVWGRQCGVGSLEGLPM